MRFAPGAEPGGAPGAPSVGDRVPIGRDWRRNGSARGRTGNWAPGSGGRRPLRRQVGNWPDCGPTRLGSRRSWRMPGQSSRSKKNSPICWGCLARPTRRPTRRDPGRTGASSKSGAHDGLCGSGDSSKQPLPPERALRETSGESAGTSSGAGSSPHPGGEDPGPGHAQQPPVSGCFTPAGLGPASG